MKKRIKALLSGLVILALTLGMLAYLTGLVEDRDVAGKYRLFPFYEEKEDIDVVFLGSSHMFCAAFPMELWKDYGIVSYNAGVSVSHLPETYWVLESVLERASPKLVVIDTFLLSEEEKVPQDTVSFVHHFLDAVPFSVTKLRMIYDLLWGTGCSPEFIWDFIAYHGRWETLTEQDFMPVFSVEKGARMMPQVLVLNEPETTAVSQVLDDEALGVEYLERILELCRTKGIDVLLTYMPFPTGGVHEIEANTAAKVAREYGVPFFNFIHSDLVDYTTDFCDGSHVNASGGRKITDYLGRYIAEHYDIPDRRGDAAYEDWYGDYELYRQYKIGVLAAQTDLRNTLMLLYDKHLSACVYLSPDELWREDELYRALLGNIGIDSDALPDAPTLAVVDNISGEVFYLGLGQTADTGFGPVTLAQTDGTFQVRIKGADVMTLSASAGVAAIDNESGAVVASGQFSISEVRVNKIS